MWRNLAYGSQQAADAAPAVAPTKAVKETVISQGQLPVALASLCGLVLSLTVAVPPPLPARSGRVVRSQE
jgi:hypothetical protein